MPTSGTLIITIRKDVETSEAAQAVWEAVQSKLADRPDLKATAQWVDRLEETPAP